MLLPVRPRPIADEPLLSYMARLAKFWPGGPWAFTAYMSGGYPTAAATVPFDLSELSEACLLPSSRLSLMSYWPRGHQRCNFLGRSVDRDMISVQRRRICPTCLRDSQHHRAFWDLAIIDACPLHGTPLIRVCPDCGQSPRWNAAAPHLCGCGYDLSRCRAEPLKADLSGIVAVARILGCLSHDTADPSMMPFGSIAGLDTNDSVSLIFHLGWWASGARRMPRPIVLASRGFTFREVLARGLRACRDWPEGFIDLLDRLRAGAPGRPGRFGVHKEFGPMAIWLETLPGGPLSDLVAAGLAAYAASRGGTSTRSTLDRLKAADSISTMTLTDAARLLHRSVVRVHAFLEKEGLTPASLHGKGAPIRIERQRILALKAEIESLVDISGLAVVLGCGEATARAVMASRRIPPAEGLAADLFGHPCWQRQEALRFVTTIEARRIASTGGQPICCIDALKILKAKGVQTSVMMDALISGRLQVIGIDTAAVGLRRIMVDKQAVKGLCVGDVGSRLPLSIPEAGRLLGVKDQVTYAWVRSGLLRTCIRSGQGQRGTGVDECALDDFRTGYLLGRELEAGLKVSRGRAAEQLIVAGVKPVSGPRIDSSPIYLFRRTEALEAWAGIRPGFPIMRIPWTLSDAKRRKRQ